MELFQLRDSVVFRQGAGNGKARGVGYGEQYGGTSKEAVWRCQHLYFSSVVEGHLHRPYAEGHGPLHGLWMVGAAVEL